MHTALGPLAAVGDTFAMLGQAPSSGQVLPLGTEVEILSIQPWPDASGDEEAGAYTHPLFGSS